MPGIHNSDTQISYLFGDSDEAKRRLELVAEVYAGSSRALLRDAVSFHPKLAVDLGCGPGYSTRLLRESLDCDQVVGLDNSEEFVRIASQASTARLSFVLHDVTKIPLPVGPADLLFCRLLLTHLSQPLDMLHKWGTQLRRGGLLLVEEVEWIRTSNPLFCEYLGIVEEMLADQGNQLYVGPLIDTFEDSRRLRRRAGAVRTLRVSNCDAARMFLLNLRTWQHRSFIRDNYAPRTIANIGAELSALVEASSAGSEIEWGMRNLVLERVAD